MKKFLKLFTVLMVGTFLTLGLSNCDCSSNPDDDSPIGQAIRGTHQLIEINIQNEEVCFTWINANDSTTYVSSVPNEHLIVFNEDITTPYIKFKWRGGSNKHTMVEIMADYVTEVQVHLPQNSFKYSYEDKPLNIAREYDDELIEESEESEYSFYTDSYSTSYSE